jgi:putative NADH-flavin reductase
MHLFVVGATGGTGREIVEQALARGHRVTAFVRSPEKLGAPRDGLTVIEGNPLSAEAIAGVLAGHDAVLSAIGPVGPGQATVVQDSARAWVSAMRATGVRRVVVLSVGLLFPESGFIGMALRRTFLRGVADDSEAMERIVGASDLDWTIVRPPRLVHGPRTGRYSASDGRMPPGAGGTATLRRSDLAHFLLGEVETASRVGQIVGIAGSRNAGPKEHRNESSDCDQPFHD